MRAHHCVTRRPFRLPDAVDIANTIDLDPQAPLFQPTAKEIPPFAVGVGSGDTAEPPSFVPAGCSQFFQALDKSGGVDCHAHATRPFKTG
jgi:hypothetical protein